MLKVGGAGCWQRCWRSPSRWCSCSPAPTRRRSSRRKTISSTSRLRPPSTPTPSSCWGASVYSDGTPSGILQDRLDDGIALYFAGAAPKIIMSGDNGTESYNECWAMKQYAISQGVPSEDVFCDHAGFSTYETMYRAPPRVRRGSRRHRHPDLPSLPRGLRRPRGGDGGDRRSQRLRRVRQPVVVRPSARSSRAPRISSKC